MSAAPAAAAAASSSAARVRAPDPDYVDRLIEPGSDDGDASDVDIGYDIDDDDDVRVIERPSQPGPPQVDPERVHNKAQCTDQFTCPCCHLLVFKAVSWSCAHIVCSGCLDRMSDKRKCPTCRAVATATRVPYADLQIAGLKVNCGNPGCFSSYCLGTDMKNEVSHRGICVYRSVECTDCKSTMQQNALARHIESQCPERKKKCAWCEEMVPVSDMPGHMLVAVGGEPCKGLVSCPNGCSAADNDEHGSKKRKVLDAPAAAAVPPPTKTIRRVQLAEHIASECTRRDVLCPAGCGNAYMAMHESRHFSDRDFTAVHMRALLARSASLQPMQAVQLVHRSSAGYRSIHDEVLTFNADRGQSGKLELASSVVDRDDVKCIVSMRTVNVVADYNANPGLLKIDFALVRPGFADKDERLANYAVQVDQLKCANIFDVESDVTHGFNIEQFVTSIYSEFQTTHNYGRHTIGGMQTKFFDAGYLDRISTSAKFGLRVRVWRK